MHLQRVVFTIALVFGAVACANWTLKTDYNRMADFSQYRTYAWLPPPPSASEARYVNTLVDQRIKQEVAARLAQKGIYEDRTGHPDFLIAYHVATEQKVDVTNWGYYIGPWWGWYGGPGVDVYSYTEGSLVIDFIDAQTRNVFWRGYAARPIEYPEVGSPKAAEAVDKMLRNYPPVQQMATTPRPRG
jgi:hypothetical protein